MRKVLIANRGEIALRIIRTCREMGLATVAVYSEADRNAPHAVAADQAFCIGPAASAESYLVIARILETARKAGADAMHPGYGFLAENGDFAQACQDGGITFIGPSVQAIRALGNKISAKELMRSAGVPCVPGTDGEEQSLAILQAEAEKIGYPILIKSAAGGGGRGMRVVSCLPEFEGELAEAKREALTSFGSDAVLLEKYIANPKHIEFQIFGDGNGNAIHLYERECSIQRRYQKIIEESPIPGLSDALRQRMGEAAVAAAQAAGYANAGTVEFLVHGEEFYFLEVNTRLQVEHPVTEEVTGLDLVRMQIETASGKPLPSQDSIQPRGHAIEARIYAEDPENGFAPSIGELACWQTPSGQGVRVDSGFREGMRVPVYYDPMLAKLIVRAEDRPAALARMTRALEEFHVLGVKTSIPFLLDVIRHPDFVAGNVHTHWLAERFGAWRECDAIPDEALMALAAAERCGQAASLSITTGDEGSPWRSAAGWRNI